MRDTCAENAACDPAAAFSQWFAAASRCAVDQRSICERVGRLASTAAAFTASSRYREPPRHLILHNCWPPIATILQRPADRWFDLYVYRRAPCTPPQRHSLLRRLPMSSRDQLCPRDRPPTIRRSQPQDADRQASPASTLVPPYHRDRPSLLRNTGIFLWTDCQFASNAVLRSAHRLDTLAGKISSRPFGPSLQHFSPGTYQDEREEIRLPPKDFICAVSHLPAYQLAGE